MSGLVYRQPFHVGPRRLRFFDLHVYRAAAAAVLGGRALYGVPLYRGMRFTYPPFAALLLAPTRLGTTTVDAILSCGLNVGALLLLMRFTAQLAQPAGPQRDGARTRAERWAPAVLVTAVTLWSEPVTVTLGYGQIDLLIALLVVWDLSRPPCARGRGLAIGVAAAVKLTPLIFIPYLMLSHQPRTARRALAAFLASTVAGFALLPADSAHFWSGLLHGSLQAGDIADTTNQCILGMVARLTHTDHFAPILALGIVLGVAAIGLLIAVPAARQGETGVGFAVCAITSLLASPISWTHHWVIAIPAIWQLLLWARRVRNPAAIGTVIALALAGFAYLPECVNDGLGLDLSAIGQAAAEPYVALSVAALLSVGIWDRRHRPRRDAPAHRRAQAAAREPIALT